MDDNYPDEKAKQIISHIVNSSGNKVRQMVLKKLKNSDNWFKIAEVQQMTKLGRKAVKAQLEMLWNLEIIDKEVRQDRIGGYITRDYDGHEIVKGGRIEDVAYYRYRSEGVTPDYPPDNVKQTCVYIGGGSEGQPPLRRTGVD